MWREEECRVECSRWGKSVEDISMGWWKVFLDENIWNKETRRSRGSWNRSNVAGDYVGQPTGTMWNRHVGPPRWTRAARSGHRWSRHTWSRHEMGPGSNIRIRWLCWPDDRQVVEDTMGYTYNAKKYWVFSIYRVFLRTWTYDFYLLSF